MAAERYDDLLSMIARESGGFSSLFDNFFGFLRRRTDFYAYALQGDRMGFPPGIAEQLLFQHYMKYRQEYNTTHPPPPGIKLPYREVTPEEEEEMRKDGRLPTKPKEGEAPPAEEEKRQPEEQKPKEETWVEPPSKSDPSISAAGGAVLDKYVWSQDVSDVTVQVNLPKGTRAKDMLVDIKVKHLKVALKAKPSEPIIEGELFERVKPDKCLWQMDRDSVILNLEKAAAVVWKSVLLGEAQGDIRASVE